MKHTIVEQILSLWKTQRFLKEDIKNKTKRGKKNEKATKRK
jgi:hypothetical protein